MRAKNIAGSVVLIGLGVAYGGLTSQLPERSLPNTPGPSFLPWVLTVCVLILGALWLLAARRERPAERGGPPAPRNPQGIRKACLGLGAMLGYVTALPLLGFLGSTPLFFGALMWIFGERRPGPLCTFAIGLPVFFYVLFRVIFQIPLPSSGILG